MDLLLAPFRPRSDWFSVGLASSFPDLVSQPYLCSGDARPGCKVFHIPRESSNGTEIPVAEIGHDLKDQVLVFRYRGKFHAIDHMCPHSSYPLSQGVLFDIEDFGVVLSAAISCPKHNWSFDLFTGMGDRGNYKLTVWDVQLRDTEGAGAVTPSDVVGNGLGETEKEVWIRRRQRAG